MDLFERSFPQVSYIKIPHMFLLNVDTAAPKKKKEEKTLTRYVYKQTVLCTDT